MEFAEVRQKFPQYGDMTDDQLATALHKKFYADVPFDQFSTKIGYKQKPAKIGEEGFSDAFKEVLAGTGLFPKMLASAGMNTINRLAEGAKQLTGQGGSLDSKQQIQANRALAEESPVGAIAGNVALGALLPGGGSIGGGIATGAASGAVEPTLPGESRLKNIGEGAAFGGAGAAAAKGLQNVAGNAVGKGLQGDKKALQDAGVVLTPGQRFGGAAARMEEAAQRLPVVGSVIASGKQASLESFNQATINKALAPLGVTLPKNTPAGHAAVQRAGQIVDAKYEQIVRRTKGVWDGQLDTELNNVVNMAHAGLPPATAKEIELAVNDARSKFTQAGLASGRTVQDIRSELGGMASRLMGSEVPSSRKLGQALKEIQSSFDKMLDRVNPGQAADMAAARRAYGALQTIETAASRLGAKEGVFTPAQYRSAVKSQDRTLRDKAFARGQARGQRFAEQAEAVMGPKIAGASPTAEYGANLLMLANPVTLAKTAAASVPAAMLYSEPALRAQAAISKARPAIGRAIKDSKALTSASRGSIPFLLEEINGAK